MPVVIRAKTAAGDLDLGHCDRKCYDADPETPCVCVCGGWNHGVGRVAAMGNGREIAEKFTNSELHPETDQVVIPGAT